jgi:hypothetical protein
MRVAPVNVFACSFVFTCSFGRKSNVRSEQILRGGYVAFFITGKKLSILWPRQIWSIAQKLSEMTISTATFAPSKPCTIDSEFLESGPNYSTRVRRLTCILRRARVNFSILTYASFWFQLSGFSSNLTMNHGTKTAKPIQLY